MRVDVAFLPSLVRHPERTVCVVIDVLRATSTLVTLFDQGIAEVVAVAEIDRAFALRDEAKARGESVPLLCGEVGGLPPAGFDYGNSPVEFSTLDLRGKRAILFTSNGTKALVQVGGSPAILVGSLLNRRRVIALACAAAVARRDLIFVCSGTNLGTAYSLEDAFCAGAMVDASASVLTPHEDVRFGDGAETALRLYRSFNADALAAFDTAEHGRLLADIGLKADLAFCAQTDVYDCVPRAMRSGDHVVIHSTSAE